MAGRRVAVISGGASGIGLGMAKAFVRAGLIVVILDIEQVAIDRAVAMLAEQGLSIDGIQVDVTNLDAMRAAADRVAAGYGAVDILCNNAGVTLERSLEDWTDIGWKWVHDVNVLGVVHGVQAFLPLLPERKGACIVNTASVVGLVGNALGLGQYVATKFALVGLSQSLRVDLAPRGIGVSILCPGAVPTNIRSGVRNAPADVRARIADRPLGTIAQGGAQPAVDATAIGDMVLAAAAANRFYILTDIDAAEHIAGEWERARDDFEWARAYVTASPSA